MRHSFAIRVADWRKLQRRARDAQRRESGETCGVLLERPGRRLELVFLRNSSESGGSFELSLARIKEIRRDALRLGCRLAGYFHSHPVSEAVPSKRDIAEAPGNSLMLIYDVCGVEAKLWRVVSRRSRKYVNEQALVTIGA